MGRQNTVTSRILAWSLRIYGRISQWRKRRGHHDMFLSSQWKVLRGICRDSIHLTCFRIYARTKFCPCIYWRQRISSIMHAVVFLLQGIIWAACYVTPSVRCICSGSWYAGLHTPKKKRKNTTVRTYCSWVERDIRIKHNIWSRWIFHKIRRRSKNIMQVDEAIGRKCLRNPVLIYRTWLAGVARE
jgi:hypothetical protein